MFVNPRSSDESDGSATPRRRFLAGIGALLAGAFATLPSVAAATVALLDPLRRSGTKAGLTRVTSLQALPMDGAPLRLTVRDERVDAWTRYADTPLGAVYLSRTTGGVRALSAVCPHAGCFVNLAPDGSRFVCPCHESVFELDGTRVQSPSPRDMYSLETEVGVDGDVLLRFRSFRPGTEEKIPV